MNPRKHHRSPMNTLACGLLLLAAGPALADTATGIIRLDLQMQWCDDLSAAGWQPPGEPIRWSDTNTASKAFYRLLPREPGEE